MMMEKANAPNPEQWMVSVSEDACSDLGQDDEETSPHKDSRKVQEQEERKALLNRKEEKGVAYLRIAVYLVVIVTAVLVSVGVYFYTKQQEEDNFEQVFETNSNKLAQAFLDSVDRKIAAVGGLSAIITNYAVTHNMSFPFVTIDNWEAMTAQTRIQADGMSVDYCPLVTDEERAGWEAYALTHKSWRLESYAREAAYKEMQDQHFGMDTRATTANMCEETVNASNCGASGNRTVPPYSESIFLPDFSSPGIPKSAPVPIGSGPFAPRWQVSFLISWAVFCCCSPTPNCLF